MSKLTYYVAATLDGHIAHEDGSFDGFPWHDDVVADFFRELEKFDTVLMGRKTYEVGLEQGKTSPYPAMRQILFSRSMEESPDEAVELVRTDAAEFVRGLKEEEDQEIWLCGGAEIASALMAAGLVDEIVVKLNPVLFYSGIPLVGSGKGPTALELKETKVYQCGTVVLRYSLLS
jgi:dihydrofolate reductase